MGNTTKKICVAGSLNVDLTLRLERFHQPGETVIAKSIHTYAGGKGGNQAVAVAKLGHPVMMVGMLGEDDNGRFYRDTLKKNGVDAECVGSAPNTPSGTAVIEVDDRGENRIAIIPGTNGLVNNAYMDSVMDRMLTCDIFMLQYEIDLATDAYLAKILHDAGKQLILDPAPAAPAPDGLYANIDFITPNATELATLTGAHVDSEEEVVRAAHMLLNHGVGAVIAKLGPKGCIYVDKETVVPVPGFCVETVDTTAAGDSFNAGFAVALAEEMQIRDALRLANAVGALSTTGAGAQSSMPTRAQVDAILSRS